MRWWLLGAGGVLLAVACVGAWYAVHSPAFWAALIAAAVSAVLPPILKRKTANEEAQDARDHRQRIDKDITGRERRR